ncbi:MAG: hypothetical protein JNN22_05950 [Rhodospirillales bacterium]|nr:hypothetical protein [Rhodospirillales bacterium]
MAGGPPPSPPPVRPCPEDGDRLARDRCRMDVDLALVAQTRYMNRIDAGVADCLRKSGFRE